MLLWSTSMFLWGGCSSSSSSSSSSTRQQFEQQQQQQLELQQLVQRQRKKLKVHGNWEESPRGCWRILYKISRCVVVYVRAVVDGRGVVVCVVDR